MSDITKTVSHYVPPGLRTVNFTNTDAGTGDVLLVRDSLGYDAKNVSIQCTVDSMQVKFNVYHTVFPPRVGVASSGDLMYTSHLANLTSGEQIKDITGATIDINANDTFEWETGPLIRDIEIVVASGQFDIWCS